MCVEFDTFRYLRIGWASSHCCSFYFYFLFLWTEIEGVFCNNNFVWGLLSCWSWPLVILPQARRLLKLQQPPRFFSSPLHKVKLKMRVLKGERNLHWRIDLPTLFSSSFMLESASKRVAPANLLLASTGSGRGVWFSLSLSVTCILWEFSLSFLLIKGKWNILILSGILKYFFKLGECSPKAMVCFIMWEIFICC